MKDLFSLKQVVHAACISALQERIGQAQAGMEQAREASTADTKSSAGDKHETARAMAQQELEKQASALHNLLEMEDSLARIDPAHTRSQIQQGALVATDKGLFYVSAAMGKLEVEGQVVLAISMQAPLLTVLKELAIGEAGTFNGQVHRLIGIA